jgi:hypothetical protein
VDAIPLPDHGFATLDDLPSSSDLSGPTDIISRAALLLITAAAEKLGMAPDAEPVIELADARPLITALAGLLAAAADVLDDHRDPLFEALATLQRAFREASAFPDAPGAGPGESLIG